MCCTSPGSWNGPPRSCGARCSWATSLPSPKRPRPPSPATTATAAPGSSDPRVSALAHHGEAVTQGQLRDVDTWIGGDHVVERTQRDGVLVGHFRVDDAAAPERVVDH